MTGSRSSGDVRMRGFAARATVDEAIAWVDQAFDLLPAERVPLEQACGRVLAGDLTASIDVPGFDRSAMDGYALRSDETLGAGDYHPLPFELIGESLPGRPFAGGVGRGQAVRIMTGRRCRTLRMPSSRRSMPERPAERSSSRRRSPR